MNIYDFDNTIYNGDTNRDIIVYSIKRHPINVIISLIKSKKLYKKYKKGLIEFKDVKEVMLSFLFKINNLDEYLDKFVDKHLKNIKYWYYNQQKNDDVIISASYEIWIKKFCDRLGIKNVIATKTDDNGKIIGKNLKGEEKVIEFKKQFNNEVVECAYSDAKIDLPMLGLAKKSYVVKGNKIIPYTKNYKF